MISSIFSNKYLRYTLIAIPVLFALSFSYFRVFELYELQTYDWRCLLRLPRAMSHEIVFIEIADDTLQKVGQWPFSREYHSAMIDILGEYGAKAVVFDIVFVEPKGKEDLAVVRSARSKGNVYFATAFKEPVWVKDHLISKEYTATLIPSYRNAAKGVGFVNVNADIDGKRRRVPLIISHEGVDHFQIGFLAAIDTLNADRSKISVEKNHSIRLSNGLRIPLDGEGNFLVNYASKWVGAFEHYSYADVLTSYVQISEHEKPRVDLKSLKGKICFIGYTATALGDVNATPIEPLSPNVGIHANVLNSILQSDFIQRIGRIFDLLIVTVLAFWILLISLRFKPVAAFRTTILTLVLYTSLVVFIFFQWGLWVDLFYPFVLSIVIYAVSTLGRTLYEVKKRELMENELKVASQIQKSFLPLAVPEHQALELAVYMKPAKAVGGDLYTFVPLEDEKLGVMLGDVSGKGTPAALFMAKAVSEFKFSARGQNDPSEVLGKFNHAIASESTGGLFVTLAYVIFDTRRNQLWMSNGGHLPVICVKPDGQAEQLTAEGGMPIGVMDDIPFSRFEKTLAAGECYALYSDGVSEARNRRKEEFSIEALQRTMQEHRGLRAQELLEKVISRLNHFMGSADQHDDITLLIVKVSSRNGPES